MVFYSNSRKKHLFFLDCLNIKNSKLKKNEFKLKKTTTYLSWTIN